MKKSLFILALSLCSIFLLLNYTQAASININGAFDLNEWAGHYSADDGVGKNGRVYPGWGGQAFDVEYMGLYIENSTVFFGLQTGFDVTGEKRIGGYLPGDFVLDVNKDSNYDYAIRFNFNSDYEFVNYSLYEVSEWNNPIHFLKDQPYRMKEGYFDHIASFGGAYDSGYFGNNKDGGLSHVLEGSFDLALLNSLYTTGDPIKMQWMMQCGNDYLIQTSAPVPEPSTLLLLGTGLIGFAGGLGRKKRFIS